jgi:CBS domain-containing protein
MTIVNDLLKIKGNDVWSVPPGATVLQALKYLAEKDIGALLVVEDDQVMGVISERDFVRWIADTETCLLNARVRDFMTKDVISVAPLETMEDCMKIMTTQRIRHLPVVDNGRLIGMISIGDVMKEMINGKELTINSMSEYIEGRGYGH